MKKVAYGVTEGRWVQISTPLYFFSLKKLSGIPLTKRFSNIHQVYFI